MVSVAPHVELGGESRAGYPDQIGGSFPPLVTLMLNSASCSGMAVLSQVLWRAPTAIRHQQQRECQRNSRIALKLKHLQ